MSGGYPVDHAGHELAAELSVDLFLGGVAFEDVVEGEDLRAGLLEAVLEVQFFLSVGQPGLHGQRLAVPVGEQVRLDPQVDLHVGHARLAEALSN